MSSRSPFFDAVTTVGLTADTFLVGDLSDIYRSVDGGVTWSEAHPDGPMDPEAFFALPPEHPHAGRLLAGGFILYSDDRGASWTEATRAFPGEQGHAASFAALPSGRVLMAGSWGVAASDDGGASYAVTPLWGDYLYDAYSVIPFATPGSVQSGAPDCGQTDPALCDGAVVLGIDATQEYLRAWSTKDGGRTWSESVPLPQPYDGVGVSATAGIVAFAPRSDGLGRALVVGRRGVLYRTTDGAQSWEAIGRMPVQLVGPSHQMRHAQLGPDGHLWVATLRNGAFGDFVYRSAEPAEAALVVSGEPAPPAVGVRLTVRPNPSAGRVAVTLELDAPAEATVAVYDARGRRVAVLHEGPASGRLALAFDSATHPSGVYVVRARAGGATASARLTVAR